MTFRVLNKAYLGHLYPLIMSLMQKHIKERMYFSYRIQYLSKYTAEADTPLELKCNAIIVKKHTIVGTSLNVIASSK